MIRRIPRPIRLALFAVCNLACWALVAATVGLLASDRVDLGVESFFRKYQPGMIVVQRPTAPVAGLDATRRNAAPALPQSPAPSEADSGQSTPGGRADSPAEAGGPPAATLQAAALLEPTTVRPSEGLTAGSASVTAEAGAGSDAQPLLINNPTSDDLGRLGISGSDLLAGRSVQIVYDEPVLNEQVQAALLHSGGLPYRQLNIDLRAGCIVITADVSSFGLSMPAQIEASAKAVECGLHLDIDTVSVAGAPVNGLLDSSVEDMILQAIAAYPAELFCIDQVVLEEGRVTLYAHIRQTR